VNWYKQTLAELVFLTAHDFPAIFEVLPLPRSRVFVRDFLVLYSCVHNGKFTVTTFKSRFSRCLNCLESFTRADSIPQKWRILGFVRKTNSCMIQAMMRRAAKISHTNFRVTFVLTKTSLAKAH
jgi:hypothetical protein